MAMASSATSRFSTALPILESALGDRYRMGRELGRGGMARVYLAQDLKHDRFVAIKVLRPELCQPQLAERFQREIRAAARLHHPNILPLHDSGEAGGLLYYVMPYVEGETLRGRLGREGALPLSEVVRLTRDLAEALDHAHRHGFVHRDVKPENVLLAEGHALLGDFGVAIALETTAGPRLTAGGILVGTPAYMSPEQATEGARLDGRSDVYSLACVIYEMLAGEQLFAGPTPHEAIARRLRHPRPALERLPAGVPRALRHTLERALAVAPAERFPTAGDLARAVAESSSAGPVVRLGAALARLTSAALRVSPNRKGGGGVPEVGCPIRRAD
jgi:serine/threonine-protein kinase